MATFVTGVCERAGKEQKESRHVQVKFPVGLNLREPKLLGTKFLGGNITRNSKIWEAQIIEFEGKYIKF